ncbi:hypothetical protein BS17DRAFT_767610 [Gyrodon lividus]|nr:hypothetical protein BS17DRAFT_767610 [Gyrodon lividus]
MPQDSCKRIYEADLSPKSSGEGSSVKPQAAEAPYCPISQLTIPAQRKPRKKHDSKATGHQGHPRDLVIPAAPKVTGNHVIVIPSRPKQARRTPTTRQNISTLVLPTEPKTSNHKIDSMQSTPGPSNMVLAPNILSESDNIAMDITDVDLIPSQTHFLARISTWLKQPIFFWLFKVQLIGLCTKRFWKVGSAFRAAPIGYQDNSEPCKINYKAGLDDPIKRAMEDYHRRISAAFKHRRSVVEQQRWLLEKLEKLQMELEKYAV